ncbi:cache domain-containing sensor histidine kinase [Cohnella lupini]|uniref:histidine kinase n=1 Tax=Cohnella lupini TaxID=1294267 RepID=A0A3D9IV53_9BACL|nr:sensor histidine kinase [Cohnella lupini]RED64996.1 two-component system sensor histidine kinase YesM [Cohnella lupini]
MQKWFRSFRHMKIKNKISVLFALIIAVTFSFTFLVQQYAFSIYDGQLYDKSAQVLNLSSAAIETKLGRIDQMSYDIIADIQLQSTLLSLKNAESEYDQHILRQKVIDRLLTYAGSEPTIYSIQLFDSHGKENGAGNVAPIDPDKSRKIMTLTKEAEGDSRWIFPDEQDAALITAREIRSFSNTNFDLEFLGTLVIRINIGKIAQQFSEAEGDLILFSGEEIIYPKEPLFRLADIRRSIGTSKGYFTQKVADHTYFISYSNSSNTGWTYMNITPFNQVFERVIFIKELVVFVFIAIFALVILLGFRFSGSLTRPIDNLIARMKMAEKGNFAGAHLQTVDDTPMSMDEMGLLHRTFRLMVERINTLITENYANQLLIKETEFKALQAQINPHFLYNTLESINWLAKVNKQTQISNMVESLGFLLRNSINMKAEILTLGEELEVVKSYVTIQKYRFDDRLNFKQDVPDELLHHRLPKLTLQPLLENAIQYALEPTIGTSTITVKAELREEGFCIVVEDDGPGMLQDTLERLRNGEMKAKGKGIGLLNIDERIKIAFGEQYGIRIDGSRERGTRIMIVLPREEEE